MSAEPYLPSDQEPVLPSDRAPADQARPDHPRPGNGAGPELPSARSTPPPAAEAPAAAGPAAARDAGAVTRTDRIREATARGPLGGHVPARYADEEWETVRSANPFEVLYLDYRQPGAIGPAVLEDRRQTLGAFWKNKEDVRNRNAGGQRERIERQYGFEVGTYAGRIERAFARLTVPGGMDAERAAIDVARRAAGEHELDRIVRTCLADGLLTVEETAMVLQEGDAVGLTREESADYLTRALTRQGFTERDARRGDTLSAVLLSTEWVSPERRTREEAAAARATARARDDAERAREDARRAAEEAADARVTPIEFNHGSAQTIPQLVDLCDRYPDEAQRYLASGAIEQWLGRAGKAGAVVEAGERRRAYPNDRAKALELFVRDLCRRIGRSAAPVLVPQPAACAFGALPHGAQRTTRVDFPREGRRLAWGSARLTPPLPGVRVSHGFADDPAGRGGAVEVALDTTYDAPGDYATELLVEPDGGEPVTIPIRYTVLPLTLTVDRPTLDLGMIPLGQTRTATVRLVASPPGGRLVGTATLGAERAGVVLTGGVQEAGGIAQLAVDSRVTGPGVQYQSEIRFETNAGIVRVPISFRVRRASTEIGRWAAGIAALGGVGMLVARRALYPGDGWHLAYSWGSHVPSVIVAGMTLWVIGLVARALLPRGRTR